MSQPAYKVQVGFQQTSGFATPFQLDSSAFGRLDTDRLGGVELVDLTSMVQSISITRGRNRDTETFNAGTARVIFRDPTRKLDPLNESSPYYPYVLPRQSIVISAASSSSATTFAPLFTGIITDWNLEYDYTLNGYVMSAQCSDNFAVFANQSLNEWTPTAQSSGDRVSAVLTRPEIEYQGGFSIATTTSTLGAYEVPAGTNALTYLNQVMASELGYLFMATDGSVVFKGRYSPLLNSGIEFREDGAGIPYQTLTNQFGDELLYNYVQFTSPAGAVQIAEDSTSIALYQSQQWTKSDLLNSTTNEVLGLAQLFLGLHKDPLLRFTAMSVLVQDLTADQQDDLFALELTNLITVQKAFAAGTPASVEQVLLVSGIEHQITPGYHSIRLNLENKDQQALFTLDSGLFGVLDQNVLAY